MRAALLGDAAVVTLATGLMGGRHKSEVSGGAVGGIEAGEITKGGEDGLGDGEVDARQSHEELNLLVSECEFGKLTGEEGDFGFDLIEQAELAVQEIAAILIDGDLRAKPFQISNREKIARRVGNESLVKNGVDAIFDASTIG